MKSARILLLTVLLASLPTLSAYAHSWYPKECCSDHDCVPADGIYTSPRGDRIVSVGHHRIWIPRSLSPRSSPDDRIHICFQAATHEFTNSYLMPICLFLPAQS